MVAQTCAHCSHSVCHELLCIPESVKVQTLAELIYCGGSLKEKCEQMPTNLKELIVKPQKQWAA